jgi:predicted enzyme related to lactoylglutathione lyase
MVKDILGVTIYVDDFAAARDFYAHILGMEIASNAGDNACFFRIADNPNAVYLEGGHARHNNSADASGLSFMLVVDSAPEAFVRLVEAGVPMVHDAPQELGEGNYWFRFYDPAGNIVEMVSSKD